MPRAPRFRPIVIDVSGQVYRQVNMICNTDRLVVNQFENDNGQWVELRVEALTGHKSSRNTRHVQLGRMAARRLAYALLRAADAAEFAKAVRAEERVIGDAKERARKREAAEMDRTFRKKLRALSLSDPTATEDGEAAGS